MSVLPPPLGPREPNYEDIDAVPNQEHIWIEEEWDTGLQPSSTCEVCGKQADPDEDRAEDCLRWQAKRRNWEKKKPYLEAARIFDAQMLYYNELRERWGYK